VFLGLTSAAIYGGIMQQGELSYNYAIPINKPAHKAGLYLNPIIYTLNNSSCGQAANLRIPQELTKVSDWGE
jgi:hypothetical protein